MSLITGSAKRLLVAIAHNDDLEFLCGGMLSMLSEQINSGEMDLFVLSFAVREENTGEPYQETVAAQDEAIAALGLKRYQKEYLKYRARFLPDFEDEVRLKLAEVVKKYDPDLVITHQSNDLNQDHISLNQQVKRVVRHATILGGEVPSTGKHLRCDAFFCVDEQAVGNKVNALSAFSREASKAYFSDDIIRAAAILRGAQSQSFELAEAFEVIKVVL